MTDTAFQNVDDDAVRAAREATLEAYRQQLIAYDTNPVPVSPDFDADTNADGLYWDSAVGAWVSTGGGGGGASLPPLWTTNDATSEITGTAVSSVVPLSLTASDQDSAALNLHPAPGGTSLASALLQIFDDTGAKVGDFDASGHIELYDLSGLPEHHSNLALDKSGVIIAQVDVSAIPGSTLFQIFTNNNPTAIGDRTSFLVAKPGTGQAVIVPGVEPGDILFQVHAGIGQTADIVQLWDLNFEGNTRFDKDARLITRVHSAPADGEIAAGDCAMWFDQTDGAAKVMFKGKTADGTVVVGNVALS